MTNEDRELCDWTAVHVMGFSPHKRGRAFNYQRGWVKGDSSEVFGWDPVENANDTQRLKGKMTELGWYCSIFCWPEEDRRTSCKFMKMDASGRSEGPDELRAVCRAAKAAMKESEW